jgi:hypothetical protein
MKRFPLTKYLLVGMLSTVLATTPIDWFGFASVPVAHAGDPVDTNDEQTTEESARTSLLEVLDLIQRLAADFEAHSPDRACDQEQNVSADCDVAEDTTSQLEANDPLYQEQESSVEWLDIMPSVELWALGLIGPEESLDEVSIEEPLIEWIAGSGPRMRGSLLAQTERIDLYAGAGTFNHQQLADLASEFERLLRQDEQRFGTQLGRRVSLGFYSHAASPSKGVRGLAYTDVGTAYVYYSGSESLSGALMVAAHELAHHLEVARYGTNVQRRADTILHEGLATWITGETWYARYGVSSWRERARQLNNAGVTLALTDAERYGANPAYELWASFCDYLIQTYGWEAFDIAYSSGRGRSPGSANYQAVYGKSLSELSAEWRAWVNS